jgi:hypothetical protein
VSLRNPSESLGNVKFSEKHKDHGSRIGDLIAPRADWSSRASVRRAIEEGRK